MRWQHADEQHDSVEEFKVDLLPCCIRITTWASAGQKSSHNLAD